MELQEMSTAGFGNWIENIKLDPMSVFVVTSKWQHIGDLTLDHGSLEIHKLKVSEDYMVGRFNTTIDGPRFDVVCQLELSKQPDILGYTNVHNINGVRVNSNLHGSGIAKQLYLFLAKNKRYSIMGDEVQYFGARRLWAKLSRENDVVVDVIDVTIPKLLHKDAVIHQGTDDWDYDLRIWANGYTEDLKHIRLILKDID